MRTTVGLFSSRAAAEASAARLRMLGIPDAHISLLLPGAGPGELRQVPTTDAEQPGVGPALGGVVGGAAGATGGIHLGAAVSALVPGIGPVVALGLVAGALLGGWAGAAVGGAVEGRLAHGVPKDELFLYEDALRHGRSVLFVLTEDDAQADVVRRLLREAGAEALDAARERWWLGVRDAEAEHYAIGGGDFESDEARYRLGFEAAQRGRADGRPYSDVVEYLRAQYPDAHRDPAFRRGFERGRAYYHGMRTAA